MEDVKQIVHRTLDAQQLLQQRSPPRRGNDLLQIWGQPPPSSLSQARDSGIQELAWAQQLTQAAMMQGFILRGGR